MEKFTENANEKITGTSKTKSTTMYLTRLGLLSAILLVMSFTPLGYLYLGPLAITFLTIPVMVGAVAMGPEAGAILGLIFGITSLVSTFSNPLGMNLMAYNAFYTVILCIVPRILEGYFCGLIFKWINKNGDNKLWKVTLASFSCPFFNTVLFMSALVLFFGKCDYIANLMAGKSVMAFIIGFVGIQAVIEAVVCTVIGTLISMALFKTLKRSKK